MKKYAQNFSEKEDLRSAAREVKKESNRIQQFAKKGIRKKINGGKKSMTGGIKINGFLTARKKIYDRWEENQ